MKPLFSVVLWAALTQIAALAQGTILFQNIVVSGGQRIVDAPVFCSDTGDRLAGAGFRAALYAGAAGTPESQLQVVGNSAAFLTGQGVGYFIGGSRGLDMVQPGHLAALQVRVWAVRDGETWEDAVASGAIYGQSQIITVMAGGGSHNPTLPQPMIGLTSFSGPACIPEPPSILPLAIIFALFRVRKLNPKTALL